MQWDIAQDTFSKTFLTAMWEKQYAWQATELVKWDGENNLATTYCIQTLIWLAKRKFLNDAVHPVSQSTQRAWNRFALPHRCDHYWNYVGCYWTWKGKRKSAPRYSRQKIDIFTRQKKAVRFLYHIKKSNSFHLHHAPWPWCLTLAHRTNWYIGVDFSYNCV